MMLCPSMMTALLLLPMLLLQQLHHHYYFTTAFTLGITFIPSTIAFVASKFIIKQGRQPTLRSVSLTLLPSYPGTSRYYYKNNYQNIVHKQQSLVPFSNMSFSTRRVITSGSESKNNHEDNNTQHNIQEIKKAKQKLRKNIRGKLQSLTQSQITTQSEKVWQILINTLPQYNNASSIGLFLSMPYGEIQTDFICNQVLKDGKELYIPRVGLDFEQCDMDLVRVECDPGTSTSTDNQTMFYHDWPRNKWGIPEPPLNVTNDQIIAKPGSIDLLIVPGLGFDKYGHRLGQGKGYYDRFISKMTYEDSTCNDSTTKKRPYLVAVGLEPCFVERLNEDANEDDAIKFNGIPTNEHDCIMDMIILPQFENALVPQMAGSTIRSCDGLRDN